MIRTENTDKSYLQQVKKILTAVFLELLLSMNQTDRFNIFNIKPQSITISDWKWAISCDYDWGPNPNALFLKSHNSNQPQTIIFNSPTFLAFVQNISLKISLEANLVHEPNQFWQTTNVCGKIRKIGVNFGVSYWRKGAILVLSA